MYPKARRGIGFKYIKQARSRPYGWATRDLEVLFSQKLTRWVLLMISLEDTKEDIKRIYNRIYCPTNEW